jgi:hypothetical protein
VNLPAYSVTAYTFARPATAITRRSNPVGMRRLANHLELRDGPEVGSVEIHAPSGSVVARTSWRDGSAEFDLSGLPRGVYIVDWVGGRVKMAVASR